MVLIPNKAKKIAPDTGIQAERNQPLTTLQAWNNPPRAKHLSEFLFPVKANGDGHGHGQVVARTIRDIHSDPAPLPPRASPKLPIVAIKMRVPLDVQSSSIDDQDSRYFGVGSGSREDWVLAYIINDAPTLKW
ncbi:hypothetical protein BX666DRAFT_2029251 [Dichotomocladium elegans]|nr:hypothetical protein BX666DRAFT_2029251 [Dichotomocladium elegans]